MKKWIIGQLISFAEVFGWTVPQWLMNRIPEKESRELLQMEASLTDALRNDELSDVQVPENLGYIIESRIKASANVAKSGPSIIGLLVPLAAFAACAMLGLYLLNTPDWVEPETKDPVDEIVSGIEEPVRAVAGLANLNNPEKGDILLRPLSSEKARLSNDVTNALKYVAQGVIPDQYMEQVNFRLDALNAEMSKPI